MTENLELPILGLSPMAGITDFAFRRICKEFGANFVVTEFISASALFYNPDTEKHLALARFSDDQKPVFIQLFGKDPDHFEKAVKIVTGQLSLPDGTRMKEPSGIDINFGCPAKKVIKNGAGCALYENPEAAREIIKICLNSTNLPISIKTRIGYKGIGAMNFLEKLQDLPYSHLTIHARTFEQQHKGSTDKEKCKQVFDFVKQKFDRKVIFNGGIKDVKSYNNAMTETGADGVLIGHGTLGNPWIFKSLKEEKDYIPDLEEIKKMLLRHTKYTIEDKGDYGIIEMRKQLGWYVKNFPGAKEIRKRLVKATTLEEIRSILSN